MRESLGNLIVAVFLAMGLVGCLSDYEASNGYRVVANDCTLILSPDPELLDYANEAAERWSAASPCLVTVGEGGVPLVLVESLPRNRNAETDLISFDQFPGEWKVEVIRFRRGYDADHILKSVMHEVWHALGGWRHVESGVGRNHAESSWPDQLAIDEMCKNLVCR